MADRTIAELTPVTTVNNTDSFVLEQNNRAMRLTGQTLLNWLLPYVDGHGGIQNISKTSTSGLVDTYSITYADGTSSTFTVTNGSKISSISKTKTSGLVDTYTISMTDGTTSTFTVTNGAKGNKGDNTYTWIRYSTNEPTKNADMHAEPDNWIGVYAGSSSSAPTAYTSYAWFKIKGDKGDKGDNLTITTQPVVSYATNRSYTTIPSSWSSDVPTVQQGYNLWTRVQITYSDSSTLTYYTVARNGVDGTGTGTVKSVNDVSPDQNGNVDLVNVNNKVLVIG